MKPPVFLCHRRKQPHAGELTTADADWARDFDSGASRVSPRDTDVEFAVAAMLIACRVVGGKGGSGPEA